MLKRKYGDRSDWKRIEKRTYAQSYIDSKDFKGYVTLLKMEKVKEPLYVQYNDKKICIADDGFCWLQHFPLGEHHSLTTMFNSEGEVVQWYLDICFKIGIDDGLPWMDDLFLDIVVLPSGEVFLLDAEELEAAVNNEMIDENLYKMAWDEASKLLKQIKSNQFKLIKLSPDHKELLPIS